MTEGHPVTDRAAIAHSASALDLSVLMHGTSGTSDTLSHDVTGTPSRDVTDPSADVTKSAGVPEGSDDEVDSHRGSPGLDISENEDESRSSSPRAHKGQDSVKPKLDPSSVKAKQVASVSRPSKATVTKKKSQVEQLQELQAKSHESQERREIQRGKDAIERQRLRLASEEKMKEMELADRERQRQHNLEMMQLFSGMSSRTSRFPGTTPHQARFDMPAASNANFHTMYEAPMPGHSGMFLTDQARFAVDDDDSFADN